MKTRLHLELEVDSSHHDAVARAYEVLAEALSKIDQRTPYITLTIATEETV